MLKGAVGSRYAGALFEIAARDGIIDQLEQELQAVNKTIASSRDLQKILYYSQITPKEKKAVVKSIFEGKISRIAFNFLYLLIDRQREAFLGDIVSFFTDLANRARNIVQVQVTSAVELTKEEKKELGGVLGKFTGKEVQASYSVDPLLAGGVAVRIGDRIIDGSIRSKLSSMREFLRQIS